MWGAWGFVDAGSSVVGFPPFPVPLSLLAPLGKQRIPFTYFTTQESRRPHIYGHKRTDCSWRLAQQRSGASPRFSRMRTGTFKLLKVYIPLQMLTARQRPAVPRPSSGCIEISKLWRRPVLRLCCQAWQASDPPVRLI